MTKAFVLAIPKPGPSLKDAPMRTTPDFTLPAAPGARLQLAALRGAFPDYTFNLHSGYGKPRFEALSKTGGNPYCLISTDVREIWRELRATA